MKIVATYTIVGWLSDNTAARVKISLERQWGIKTALKIKILQS